MKPRYFPFLQLVLQSQIKQISNEAFTNFLCESVGLTSPSKYPLISKNVISG